LLTNGHLTNKIISSGVSICKINSVKNTLKEINKLNAIKQKNCLSK